MNKVLIIVFLLMIAFLLAYVFIFLIRRLLYLFNIPRAGIFGQVWNRTGHAIFFYAIVPLLLLPIGPIINEDKKLYSVDSYDFSFIMWASMILLILIYYLLLYKFKVKYFINALLAVRDIFKDKTPSFPVVLDLFSSGNGIEYSSLTREFPAPFIVGSAITLPYICLNNTQLNQIAFKGSFYGRFDAICIPLKRLSNYRNEWQEHLLPNIFIMNSDGQISHIQNDIALIFADYDLLLYPSQEMPSIEEFDKIVGRHLNSFRINAACFFHDNIDSKLYFFKNFVKLPHPIPILLKLAFSSPLASKKTFLIFNILEVVQKYLVFFLLLLAGHPDPSSKENLKNAFFRNDSFTFWTKLIENFVEQGIGIDIFPELHKQISREYIGSLIYEIEDFLEINFKQNELTRFTDLFRIVAFMRNKTRGHGIITERIGTRAFPILFQLLTLLLNKIQFENLIINIDNYENNFNGILLKSEFPEVPITNVIFQWNGIKLNAQPWIIYSSETKDFHFFSEIRGNRLFRIAYNSGEAIKPARIG